MGYSCSYDTVMSFIFYPKVFHMILGGRGEGGEKKVGWLFYSYLLIYFLTELNLIERITQHFICIHTALVTQPFQKTSSVSL